MTDIVLKGSEGRFHFRVGGAIFHEGKVLLVTDERFDYWFLPGGKAALLEPSDEVLKREVFEELGFRPIVERVLWTTESFFNEPYWGGAVHEVAVLYLMRLPEGCPIYRQESGEGIEEDKVAMQFRWFDLQKLDNIVLVPRFLKQALKDIPQCPQHVITNEL